MGKAQWGSEPEFFGPRHAHREGRILRSLRQNRPKGGKIHLECAAGLGSLSRTLAREGILVVAADLSMPSLLAILRKEKREDSRILPVLADITNLPFPDGLFPSASSAETLEHIPDDGAATRELGRVLAPGGVLVGSVPAGPDQWSDWDVWADHQRRYTRKEMEELLRQAGLQPKVRVWGWPILRLYDGLFLKKVNRKRLQVEGKAEDDPGLKRVSGLGRSSILVGLVRSIFSIDRLFDGLPWGVGLLFTAKKDLRAKTD